MNRVAVRPELAVLGPRKGRAERRKPRREVPEACTQWEADKARPTLKQIESFAESDVRAGGLPLPARASRRAGPDPRLAHDRHLADWAPEPGSA